MTHWGLGSFSSPRHSSPLHSIPLHSSPFHSSQVLCHNRCLVYIHTLGIKGTAVNDLLDISHATNEWQVTALLFMVLWIESCLWRMKISQNITRLAVWFISRWIVVSRMPCITLLYSSGFQPLFSLYHQVTNFMSAYHQQKSNQKQHKL